MKIFNLKRNLFSRLSRCVGALAVVLGLAACTESVNEGNFAIKTEETAIDYLSSKPQFSDIMAVYDRVRLGNSETASVLSSVLGARGNYTIFAPNNEAMKIYLEGLGVSSVDELTYEDAKLIAFNSIIDNRDEAAYESADFPTPGSFSVSNLNDRTLTCEQDESGASYVINTNALVLSFDNEVSNGMIHEVDHVIAPSSDDVATRLAAATNMQGFSHLLTATGWDEKLVAYLDLDYQAQNWEEVTDYRLSSEKNTVIYRNTSRYDGYTVFAEPDEVFASEWGINFVRDEEGLVTNWDEVMAQFTAKCEEVYGTAERGNLTHPDNAVNRFVAYHLVEGKMAYDKFVHHCSEYNYKYGSNIQAPQTDQMPTNVWDYYATMGDHRSLIKITQVGDAGFEQDLDHSIYLNRISEYDNGRKGDYHETGVKTPGILISPNNGEYDNNAQNGFYFPINKVLVYNDEIRDYLANERLRVDMVTMLPELITNGNRGIRRYTLFEKGYIKNVSNESSDTHFIYLMAGTGAGWNDYQGDEFLICGLYDFTLKLPPVPKKGTYELRMGTALNSMRGMAQIYFGSDPLRLSPAGLPYDMRQTVNESNVEIPWKADTEDDEENAENDKNLRNHGYLKGPNYFTVTDGKAETPVRMRSGGTACIRRIITTAEMDPDKTYYLRFKTALKKLDSQFFLDYFEFVPTTIYNGVLPEDIW